MATTPRFSPASFFFTDPEAISQSADQAFGPVSADVYRLTSKFSIGSADVNAYAVCTGIVLVQPQSDNSGLVNLILRPFKQPITGFNIKYFIYRGLDIGDFFDGNNVIAAGDDTSDFIKKINASFAAYYASIGESIPTFLASYIGFDPTNQPATTLIADLFFKITDDSSTSSTDLTAFELPIIAAGASLGTFGAGECGFDIVLDYGDYKLPTPNDQFVFDLTYARDSEITINLSAETNNFQKKLLREQIFQFLDVAAYYGFHYSNGVVMVSDNGTISNKKGDDIYSSVIQNFNTKNTLYLYIQSDRTRSYNFYGNYQISDDDTNCLKVGAQPDALTESTYQTNGWPLLIINTPQATNDPNGILYVQFVTDNNDNKVLYGQVAQLINAQGNNFSGPDDLQLPADDSGDLVNFTKIMQLSNPVSGTDGAKNYVAAFNILIYQGSVYDYVTDQTTDDENDITDQPDFFDDMFEIASAIPLLKTDDSSAYTTVTFQRLKLINHFYNDIQYGASVQQTSIINDVLTTNDTTAPELNRVIYITEPIEILNNVISVSGTITPNTQSSSTFADSASSDLTYQLPAPFYLSTMQFTDDTDMINGLLLQSSDGSIPTKIILGISKDENDILLALLSDNSLQNTRLYLISLFDTQNDLVSVENIVYTKFNAGVVGEETNGQLQLKMPDTDITVYSIDRKYYYSKAFSEYVIADSSQLGLILNLDISL